MGTVKLIAVIRHAGTPNEATTRSGQHVERSKALWYGPWRAMIPCEDYDDHFIYRNTTVGEPSYFCTCGSAAVVTPLAPKLGDRYVIGPQIKFVCYLHKLNGKHVTSELRRDQYEGLTKPAFIEQKSNDNSEDS